MSSGRGGGDGGGKVDGSGEVGVGSKEGWSGGVGTKEENGIVYISYTHGPVQAPGRGGARDEARVHCGRVSLGTPAPDSLAGSAWGKCGVAPRAPTG